MKLYGTVGFGLLKYKCPESHYFASGAYYN